MSQFCTANVGIVACGKLETRADVALPPEP